MLVFSLKNHEKCKELVQLNKPKSVICINQESTENSNLLALVASCSEQVDDQHSNVVTQCCNVTGNRTSGFTVIVLP